MEGENDCSVVQLPGPAAGAIRQIVHIADLHIRAGEGAKARYEEYANVFDRLLAALGRLDSVKDGSAVVLIAGDLFHHKDTISPPGVLLLRRLIRGLSELAPVYVIRGNHDHQQCIVDPDEPDLISAFLAGEDASRIVYLNSTGLYESRPVGFGLLAIQDVLARGQGSGRVKDPPSFPDPRGFDPDRVTRSVALFHGPVAGCRLQTGITMDSQESIPQPANYDWGLLGDIHLQQVSQSGSAARDFPHGALPESLGDECFRLGEFSSPKWGYPGSLVQQNFGETVLGHGFLLWDVPSGACASYHVANPWGLLTLVWTPDGPTSEPRLDECGVDHVHPSRPKDSVSLVEARGEWWFPTNVRVRVSLSREQQSRWRRADLETQLQDRLDLCVCEGVREHSPVQIQARTLQERSGDTPDNLAAKIQFVNSPDAWVEYVRRQMVQSARQQSDESLDALHGSAWEQMLRAPEGTLVPVDADLPVNVAAGARERNKKVAKVVMEYDEQMQLRAGSPGSTSWPKLRLLRLDWDWVLCYGDGCWWDFTACDGHLAVLAGANATGKSALLDILVYALFGKGPPSREASGNAAAMVCMSRPHQQRARVSVMFQLGQGESAKRYRLSRSLDVQDNKLTSKHVKLDVLCATGGTSVPHQTSKSQTDKWIEKNIGPADAFLQACLVSQNSDGDFYGMHAKEQVEILDRALSLHATKKMMELLKESRLAHESTLKNLESELITKREAREDLVRASGPGTHEDAMGDNLPRLRDRMTELQRSSDELSRALHSGRYSGEARPTCEAVRLLLSEDADLRQELASQGPLPDEQCADVLRVLVEDMPAKPCDEATLIALRSTLSKEWPGDDDFAHEIEEYSQETTQRADDARTARDALERSENELAEATAAQAREAERGPGPPPAPPRTTDEEMVCWPPADVDFDTESKLSEDEASLACLSLRETRRAVLQALTELQRLPAHETTHEAADAIRATLAQECDRETKLRRRSVQEQGKRPPGPTSSREELEAAGVEETPEQAAAADVALALEEKRQRAERIDERARHLKKNYEECLRVWKDSKNGYTSSKDCEACRHNPHRINLVSQKNDIQALDEELKGVLREADCADLKDIVQRARRGMDALHWRKERARWEADASWQAMQKRLTDAQAANAAEIARLRAELAATEEYLRGTRALREDIMGGRKLPASLDDLSIVVNVADALFEARYRLEERGRHAAWNAWREAHVSVDARLSAARGRVLEASESVQVAKRRSRDAESALQERHEKLGRLRSAHQLQTRWAEDAAQLKRFDEAWAAWQPRDAAVNALGHVVAQEGLRVASAELASVRDRVAAATRHLTQWQELEGRVGRLKTAFASMSSRTAAVKRLADLMDGFKAWAYADQLLPIFIGQINSNLALMLADGEESLRLTVTGLKSDVKVPCWRVADANTDAESLPPPYQKASGFQRSMVSFATRLALARLGATQAASCAQLFVDEGFVACDAANLERIPGFLQGLLADGCYDSIVLITHMESLARSASLRINMQRDHALRLSCMRWPPVQNDL